MSVLTHKHSGLQRVPSVGRGSTHHSRKSHSSWCPRGRSSVRLVHQCPPPPSGPISHDSASVLTLSCWLLPSHSPSHPLPSLLAPFPCASLDPPLQFLCQYHQFPFFFPCLVKEKKWMIWSAHFVTLFIFQCSILFSHLYDGFIIPTNVHVWFVPFLLFSPVSLLKRPPAELSQVTDPQVMWTQWPLHMEEKSKRSRWRWAQCFLFMVLFIGTNSCWSGLVLVVEENALCKDNNKESQTLKWVALS